MRRLLVLVTLLGGSLAMAGYRFGSEDLCQDGEGGRPWTPGDIGRGYFNLWPPGVRCETGGDGTPFVLEVVEAPMTHALVALLVGTLVLVWLRRAPHAAARKGAAGAWLVVALVGAASWVGAWMPINFLLAMAGVMVALAAPFAGREWGPGLFGAAAGWFLGQFPYFLGHDAWIPVAAAIAGAGAAAALDALLRLLKRDAPPLGGAPGTSSGSD